MPNTLLNTIKLLYKNLYATIDSPNDCVKIKRGVLQGGILSPYFFNIFIDDLANELIINGFKIYLFADDLAILTIGLK